jgi:class 3 adenylate cyclase/tetratricopeptide (TPR) repeat protein
MFCDMVGSSALSTRLDPEEQRDVVGAFQSCCASEIKRLDGFVAQYLGDGVLAYFGYPAAHEDDAERAIRAGLAILDAVRAHKPAPEVALGARLGVATGVVVVGDLVRESVTQENAAIGETTNLAARLQSLAEPNTLVISPDTHRQVGALFEYHDLGWQTLKGFAEPLHVRQVLGASTVENRFEAQHPSGSSALLGRDEELDLLLRRWGQAKRGQGRVVLLSGEAGIGKSRLTRAFQERLAGEPHTPLVYHCSPYHQESALHPIIGQLLRAADIERDDSADIKLHKLETLLAQSSENLSEEVPLFAALLSIPESERYPLPNLTPQRLKERTLGALLGQLKRLAARTPALMVFEDLHWIDPTSLELLSLAVDQAPGLRVLLIVTSRPEFTPPWASHQHISTVSLSRLGRSEGQTLVTGITKGKALPPEVLEQILHRTDGVPLFIEELTKTVLESGLLREAGNRYELMGSLAPFAIPSTLHASLLARLDRLASVKDVAQIGAAIGREFPYGLIAAVSALPERDLQAALLQLVGAELIFQRGTPPDATYLFKHALVQEAAYGSLVRSRRQQLHGHIARTLEERYPDIVATEPELAAYHFTEAGLIEPAIDYRRRAGEHFLARSAYIEAVKHLTQAIEMLGTMPETPKTLGEELDTRIKMAPAVLAVSGAGSVEVETLYLRAQDLVERLGRTSLRFPVLWGLWFIKYNRGQYAAAREAGESLLDAGQTGGDSGQILEGHHALWALLSVMGNAEEAVRHMERGIAVYDRKLHASQAFLYAGHDPGACCRYHLAKNLWLLGHLDQSMTVLKDALHLAEQLKHPPTSVITLWFAAWVQYHRGDRPGMTASLEQLAALATEHGIFGTRDFAIVLLDADARAGREKLIELNRGLHVGRATGRVELAPCVLRVCTR